MPEISKVTVTWQSSVCIALANALPDSVFSNQHPDFHKSVNSYWSLNACEIKPTCVVRPQNSQEVAAAIKLLKAEFDITKDSVTPLQFAIRSGGHSPEAGFASIAGHALIDMSLINQVDVYEDEQTVRVGVGARWCDVTSRLDSMGLATLGGRNSNVGVGGFVLGGGISFFSPRYGMACDNVEEYEIVLADGTIAQVTRFQHEDLWRALKGGSGNFGIVTHIKARTFSSGKIWAGYAYWTGWQTPNVLKALIDFNKPENSDEFAAGPIVAIGYVQKLGVRIAASSLAYTKPEKWPHAFKAFNSLWRLWNTTKIQPITDATNELANLSPPGQRQFQVTTTIKNDLDTLLAINDIYTAKLKEVKNVKGAIWALIIQPLSAALIHKGSPNVLGFKHRPTTEPLLILLVTVAWPDVRDEELVHQVAREIIASGEEVAREKGTADPYLYLNYAASGQDPIGSYGAENKTFLQEMSRKYDPEGFFQRAKQGGFKLGIY